MEREVLAFSLLTLGKGLCGWKDVSTPCILHAELFNPDVFSRFLMSSVAWDPPNSRPSVLFFPDFSESGEGGRGQAGGASLCQVE